MPINDVTKDMLIHVAHYKATENEEEIYPQMTFVEQICYCAEIPKSIEL